jgi:hypothetical protein
LAINESQQRKESQSQRLGETITAQEMRGLLRSMTPAERNKAISEAIAADDNAVLSAVLHEHPLATGLTPLEHAALRLRWQKSRYPQQIERRDRLVKASDDLERIVHLYVAWTDGLTNGRRAPISGARRWFAARDSRGWYVTFDRWCPW